MFVSVSSQFFGWLTGVGSGMRIVGPEYDAKDHKTGETRPGLLGGMNHYDDRGHKTGHSDRSLLGDWNHYDD